MSRLRAPIALFALIALGAAMAAPSIDHPFVFDDIPKIVHNPDIARLDRLVYPYSSPHTRERNDPSRPLVFFTYALNYAVGGLSPIGYHAVDIALHVLASFLLFSWARRWGDDERVSLFVALVFLVHPLMFSTALYVYARADLLAAVFMLAGLLAWSRDRRKLATLSFIGALASKQSAIVLPLLFLACDLTLADARPNRLWIRRYLGLMVVAAIYLVLRLAFLGGLGDLDADPRTLWSVREYLDVQPYVIARYIQLILVPMGLSADHVVSPRALGIGWRLVGYATLAMAAVLGWKTRSPRVRFHLAMFFLLVLPTSSFLPTADAMVERRVYLASAGLLMIVVPVIGSIPRTAYYVVCGAVLAILIVLSMSRGSTFASEETLWTDVLETYPADERALLRLAQIHAQRSDDARAIELFDRLFRAYPRHFAGYNSIGALYFRRHEYDLAEKFFRFAIEIDPTYSPARENLARLEVERPARAANAEVKTATASEPLDPGPVTGSSAYKASLIQNRALVVSMYRAQIEKHPETTKYRRKLIDLFLFLDSPDDALVELRALAEVAPDDVEVRQQIQHLEVHAP